MSDSKRANLIILNLVVVAAIGMVSLAAYLIVEQKKTGKETERNERLLSNQAGESGARPIGLETDLGMTVPDFEMETATGGTLSLNDLKGKVWTAEFVFTNCAGICIEMSEMTRKLQDRTKDLQDLRLVSFSVDPMRDSLLKLKEYGDHYGAIPERWHFVRGDVDEIAAIGVGGFKLFSDQDSLTHSGKCALVDRTGRIRGFYGGSGPERVAEFERLEMDIRRLLAEAQ